MDYKYYIGEGPEALAVKTAIKEKLKDVSEARNKFMEDFGIDELITEDGGKSIAGVTFKGEVPEWAREIDTYKDKPFYSGNRSYKIGSEFCSRKDELTYMWPDDLLEKCGMHHRWLIRGHCMYQEKCGYTEDKILVGIPFDSNTNECDDKMPTIPSWMHEVKESEWLAAAGR